VNPVATYSFLPWLRQGIANTITTQDLDTSVRTRASTHVVLRLSGDPVADGAELTADIAQDIALYGPGDVIGIDPRAIIRTDPGNWITNFEGNYLPAVDFYDADFPWRYTPAAADPTGLRLRPWITLIVLAESEFTESQDVATRPSPYITVPDASVFPPATELWAWAHVHVNDLLSADPTQLVAPDMTAVLPKLQAIVAANRDAAYSRLLCPRKLNDNTAYHAFVVPTFETGRLAGLGLDPTGAPHATFSAWAGYNGRADAANYPIYYRWYFRTGAFGDFEYLVEQLKAQPVDPQVGTRDMDVQDPGSNIPGITNPALGGVLRLGGALQVPDADLDPEQLKQRNIYENWDQPYPDSFEKSLAAFVNLPDDYAAQTAAAANAASNLGPGVSDDPDPLITAPLYCRWHALTQRLLTNRDGTPAPDDTNWVHRLNLDPRFRVPAALGARVVEANAESYMDDAWQQIGDVLAANALIRRLHLATAVSSRLYQAHLTPLATANPEHAFALLAPVSNRVLMNGATLAHTESASLVQPALTSAAMRRVIRPGGRLMRSLPFDASVTPADLLARVNAGEVSAAPPKAVPAGIATVGQAAAAAATPGIPPWTSGLLTRYPWLPTVVLDLAAIVFAAALILLFTLLVAGIILLAVSAGLAYTYWVLRGWQASADRVNAVGETGQTPASVAALPKSPDFVLSVPGSAFRAATGASDSPTAVRFKDALRGSYTLLQDSKTAGQRPVPAQLPLAAATAASVAAVDPAVTIPKRGLTVVGIPPWVRELMGDAFNEVMAYPKIDLPMYQPLKGISIEFFLPNINLIAENSITLIETNQRFVEAYMGGLNYEFGRKLMWREYPTDQRGSYFRQFWDVGSYIDSEGLSTDALKEKLYDIPELHLWPLTSALGTHNNRAAAGQTGEQAVLVVRGELLKRYPNTMIYAQHAVWPMKDGRIDLSQPRSLDELTPAEELNPPRSKIRSPLYEAKADPDIYFFGFDLTIPEAEGGSGENPGDDPGWFFVIKQRPGEPRFGLETSRTGVLDVFDELTWDDALPGAAPGQFLPAGGLDPVTLASPSPPEVDRQQQHDDDEQVDPAAASSARWAYLLFRAPVLVAVHADQMLGQGGS
jgi:hypothetical protein